MKRYSRYAALICLSVVLLLTGCKKWLGVAPKGILTPESLEDFDKMLNAGELSKLSSTEALFLTDDVYRLPEDDVGVDISTIQGAPEGRMYAFVADGNYYTEADCSSYYDAAYSRIYTYNFIINNVMSCASEDQAKARVIQAEAKCGRAMEYLLLINLYAPHYDASTAAHDFGVPLILDNDLEARELTKSSVAEVYEQVLKDLMEGGSMLPLKPLHNTSLRFSRPAALALIARAHFFMGDWANALLASETLLATRSELVDWTVCSLIDSTAFFGRSDLPQAKDNEENIILRFCDYSMGIAGETYLPDDLLSLYDRNNDQRYLFQAAANYFGETFSDPALRLFVGASEFNAGVSTPEIYLIAAECKVRKGDVAGGLQLLDELRNNRIIGNTPLPVGTQEDALRHVLDERRRELYGHSVMRLLEIKRLAKEPEYAITITRHLLDGESVALQGEDSRLILPIPPQALRHSPNMKPRG